MRINAIDVEQLKAMQEKLRADPAIGNKSPAVTVRWLGEGSAEVTMGDRKMLVGGDGNLNAMGALLGSLGACDIDVVLMHAALQGLTVEDLRIDVKGEFNTSGFYGATSRSPEYTQITYTVHLKAPGATPEQLAYLKEKLENSSPVGKSLKTPVTFSIELMS